MIRNKKNYVKVCVKMNNEKNETIKQRYNRISNLYDYMDRMIKKDWRIELLSKVRGEILEVGIGTGANLPYYPKEISLTGIDFSPGMLRFARNKAEQIEFPLQLLQMDAQSMNFSDNSFDFVVTTCVYCSVPDPIQGLKEMRRVVKPEGKVIMLEHMRSEAPFLGLIMDALNPLTVRMTGANINRRTLENIKQAGFIIEGNEKLMGSVMRRLVLDPNK